MRQKRKLTEYDTLKLEKKDNDISLWNGERGKYIFKQPEKVGSKYPVKHVMLNRSYLTGIFKTKESNKFSGDIKDSLTGDKVYLVFVVENTKEIKVFKKE